MLVRISSAVEWLWMIVIGVDRVANRHFEFSYAADYTASNLAFCKDGEPTFDEVDPGDSSGREVEMKRGRLYLFLLLTRQLTFEKQGTAIQSRLLSMYLSRMVE